MCAFGVPRFGTERLYAQKEDLLHEVLELEAEKGLLASGESTKYQVGVRGVILTVSVLLTPNVAVELRSCQWLNSFGNGNEKWKNARYISYVVNTGHGVTIPTEEKLDAQVND